MLGSIRSRQKCCKCGEPLIHDERRNGCFCKKHPEVAATSFIVWFPKDIYQRHSSYESACQALNYLRHEKGIQGKGFKPEDYKSIRPNSFSALAPKYLEKKKKLGRISIKKIEGFINRAAEHFKDKNLKDISGVAIEEYLDEIPGIGEKTRSNHASQLHDFWCWALKRGAITLADMPSFPEIEYELGFRNVTTWENQGLVIEKIKERTCHINPKIWLAVEILALHTELRPDDIRRIREKDFMDGFVTIYNPTKKRKPKTIHLDEHYCYRI